MAIEIEQHSVVVCSSSTERLTNTTDSSINRMTLILNVLKSITLEPVIFIIAISLNLSNLYLDSLLMYKICRVEFKNDSDTCHNLTSIVNLETAVQKVAANYQLYFTILETIPSLIFLFFLGSWSDRFGRKFPMVLQISTYLVSTIIPILAYEIEELSPSFLLLMPTITSLSGGFLAANVIFCSYLSDITDEKTRTLRFSIVNGVFYIGCPIGSLLAGFLLKNWGYTCVFGVGVFLNSICLLYTMFFIKESLQSESGNEHKNSTFDIKHFFNYKNCHDMFRTFTKKRNGNKRRRLWILTVCNLITMLGSVDMLYLYARLKFEWSDQLYSYFVTYCYVVGFFAAVVLLPFLIKCLKVKDSYLYLIGLIGILAQYNIIAFAVAGWMLFLALLILVNECVSSPIRSLLSQCVDPDEVGKMFSALAILGSLGALIRSTIYTQIYHATLDVFPGTVYLVGAGFFLIAIFIMFYIKDVKNESDEPAEQISTIPENQLPAKEVPVANKNYHDFNL